MIKTFKSDPRLLYRHISLFFIYRILPDTLCHHRNGAYEYQSNQKHSATVLHVHIMCATTGFSSEIGTKLRDWAVGQAGGSCYSQAALSSNDSKTL